MDRQIKILVLEDDLDDVELIRGALLTHSISFQLIHVQNSNSFTEALSRTDIDLILSDFQIPSFSGLEALEIRKQKRPLIPFIFVSGRMGEEFAIETLKSGATDYVLKDSLDQLPSAVQRALQDQKKWVEDFQLKEKGRVYEEKYKSLFEQYRDAIYITDQEGQFVDVNSSAALLFGYSPEEMLKMKVTDLFSEPEKGQHFKTKLDQCGSIRDQEQELVKKDGTAIHCLVTTMVRFSEDRQIIGYQGIVHNITDRKEMEKAMFDAQKLESLGVLAGGIAHDFNNLLSVIQGNAELAAREISTQSPGYPFIEQIEIAAQRSAELCRQLLAYAGKNQLVMQPLNLNPLIQDISQLLQVSVGKNVKLQYHLFDKLPPIQGDPTQLRQVILNLVLNASEAIGSTPGLITLTTSLFHASREYLLETRLGTEFEPGEYVYFEVLDNGCGMEPKTLDRIFDPFFTTKFTGRGLGLAAVLGIIRSHHGTLKVSSQEGFGTQFQILIPPTHEKPSSPPLQKTPSDSWRGKGTVLVVDDEGGVRIMVSRMVESLGFEVLQAENGKHALEIFKESMDKIVLVILDMTMPEMTGDRVFQEIQILRPDSRVLLMSGYSEEQAAHMFSNFNLSGFIQKPFKLTPFKEKIQSILHNNPAPSPRSA